MKITTITTTTIAAPSKKAPQLGEEKCEDVKVPVLGYCSMQSALLKFSVKWTRHRRHALGAVVKNLCRDAMKIGVAVTAKLSDV